MKQSREGRWRTEREKARERNRSENNVIKTQKEDETTGGMKEL